MKIKMVALSVALVLNVFNPALASNHLDMTARSLADEAQAQSYFDGSRDVPVSDSHPLWQNLSSEVDFVAMGRDVIDNMNHLYAVNPDDGGIYRYRAPRFDDERVWEKIGGPGRQFAVAGGRLYGVSPNGQAVYAYNGYGWRWIGGVTDKLYGGEGGLFRTVPGSGDIYRYDVSRNTWQRVGGAGADFAVGGPGKLYGISRSGSSLYQWSGVVGGRWTRIRDSVNAVYANGDAVFVVDAVTGDIHRYNGTPFSWTRIGGPGKQFAVVHDDLVYGISPDGNGVWRYTNGRWQRIGEAAESLHVAGEELVVKTGDSGSLWRYLDMEPEQAGFVIIVKDKAMEEATRDFVAWKRAIGHKVSVVTIPEIESFSNGQDLAERIRNYLMDVKSSHLHYVMLIGNVDQVPTRMLYPGRTRSNNLPYAADFYYADLHTTDWDRDGDGEWGEFDDDRFDWNHDVVLSRVPLNDPNAVKDSLDNMIAFEQDDRGWKFNSLQAAGFMDEHTDGAEMVELADTKIFGVQWLLDKLYIDEPQTGTMAGEQSAYIAFPGVQRLTRENYRNAMGPQSHSLVVLTAHGDPTFMGSHSCDRRWQYNLSDHKWELVCDYRHLVHFGHQADIGADFTSAIVALNGCSTAAPLVHPNDVNSWDPNASLFADKSLFDTVGSNMLRHNGQAYLEGGAASVIGASAGGDYKSGWSSPSDRGSSTLFYRFQENLVARQMSVGDAFFEAQREHAEHIELERGLRVFYLMGDPSLKIVGQGRK